MPHNKIDIIFVLMVLVLFYYVYLICNDQVGVINMSSSSEWYQFLSGVYSVNEVAGVYWPFSFQFGRPQDFTTTPPTLDAPSISASCALFVTLVIFVLF